MKLYWYQRSRSFIDLGPNHSDSIFLNLFSSITAVLTYPQHSGERYRTSGPLVYMYLSELEFSKCCHENFDVILDVFEFLEFWCQFLASFSAKRFDVLPSTSLVGAKPTTYLLNILIFQHKTVKILKITHSVSWNVCICWRRGMQGKEFIMVVLCGLTIPSLGITAGHHKSSQYNSLWQSFQSPPPNH